LNTEHCGKISPKGKPMARIIEELFSIKLLILSIPKNFNNKN